MSSNIYEDPDLTWKVRYNNGARGDRGERVERRVDIYESAEPITGRRGPTDAGARGRTAAALGFGLLSLVLLVGLAVLSRLYVSILTEKQELGESHEDSKSRINDGCRSDGNNTDRRSWSDSRADCRGRDADLAVIDDRGEHEFVAQLSARGASWVGLRAVDTGRWELQWQWVDGSPPSFILWHDDVNVQPADPSTAYMEAGSLRYTNNGSKHWICERKMF